MLAERVWLEAHGDMSEAMVNERKVPAGDTPLQWSGGKRTEGASWWYTTAVERRANDISLVRVVHGAVSFG